MLALKDGRMAGNTHSEQIFDKEEREQEMEVFGVSSGLSVTAGGEQQVMLAQKDGRMAGNTYIEQISDLEEREPEMEVFGVSSGLSLTVGGGQQVRLTLEDRRMVGKNDSREISDLEKGEQKIEDEVFDGTQNDEWGAGSQLGGDLEMQEGGRMAGMRRRQSVKSKFSKDLRR